MAMGGRTAVHNFRKIHSENSKKSKYASVVKTAEEIEAEKLNNEASMNEESEEEEEKQEAQSKAKKDYSMNDIMDLDRLTIGKKKKQDGVKEESKGIKKPN